MIRFELIDLRDRTAKFCVDGCHVSYPLREVTKAPFFARLDSEEQEQLSSWEVREKGRSIRLAAANAPIAAH